MLTLYKAKNSFKKKLTVIVIWLTAFLLSIGYIELVLNNEIPFIYKLIPLILGLFMIAGILLRCKIARGLTLLTLYILALYPLIFNFMFSLFFPDITMYHIVFLSVDSVGLLSNSEALLTNIVWASALIIPIYFLSNNDSMEIFYIENNPKEHLLYAVIAILLIALYFYYIDIPLLEKFAQPML